jgi:serine/threonine-protein kinase
MGVVVAARHLQLDQLLAVKLMPASAARDSVAAQRFQQEARAAAKLQSDHVARVLDVGELPTGEPFMVMEYLAGADLAEVLDTEGPLAVGVACDYLVQACEAVGEAHAFGIVHRDLKPENLHLSADVAGRGFVKVLDFGVSKLMTPNQGALTTTKTVIGSPLYMAPEQLRSSRQADPRSDVWALGVVLYELLTRRWPFEAESLPELCLKVVQEAPRPIAELRPGLPRGVVGVIERCLQKDPTQRFANASELARALAPFTPAHERAAADSSRASEQNLVATLPAEATTVAGRASRRWGAAAWLLVALVLALAGAWAADGFGLRGGRASPASLAFAAVGGAVASWDSTDVSALPAAESPVDAPTRPPPAASAPPAPRMAGVPRPVRVAPKPAASADDDIPAFR